MKVDIDVAKSMLAKLMASENITIIHSANAQTASFDLGNRVLTLPSWKNITNDMYDMILVHETGHALDTPTDGWKHRIKEEAYKLQTLYTTAEARTKVYGAYTGIVNIVEDVRIDMKQKKRYPGSIVSYRNGYNQLWEQDFFNLDGKNPNKCIFADKLNMFYKGGANRGLTFSDYERDIVKRCAQTRTFEDVLRLAIEVFKYSKDDLDQKQSLKEEQIAGQMDDYEEGALEPQEINPEGLEDDDNEEENEECFEASDNDAEEDMSSEDDEEAASGEGDAEEDGDEDSEDGDTMSIDSGRDGISENVPEPFSDSVLEDYFKDHIDHVKIAYVTPLRYANSDKFIHHYRRVMKDYPESNTVIGTKEFNNYYKSEIADVNYMVKEFEMKKAAAVYNRGQDNKSGILNMDKIHSYKFNDDIFLRNHVEPKGKNHGMIFVMDWSISMGDRIFASYKKVLSLIWFCKKVQIPFEFYIFRTDDTNGGRFLDGSLKTSNNLLLRNILSSDMTNAEFRKMAIAFWDRCRLRNTNDPLGMTPLNEALHIMYHISKDFVEKHDVEILNTIFLTDGQGQILQGAGSNVFKYICRDNITRNEYAFSTDPTTQTKAFLEMLKDRVAMNTLGFFICDMKNQSYGNNGNSSFEKDRGYAISKDSGYDELYTLDINKFGFDNTENLNSNHWGSIKFNDPDMKKKNRMILSRFIDNISKEIV